MTKENTMKIKEQKDEHQRKEDNDKGKYDENKGTGKRT